MLMLPIPDLVVFCSIEEQLQALSTIIKVDWWCHSRRHFLVDDVCRCDVRALVANGSWVMHIAVKSGTDCLMLRCSPFSERAGDFGLGKAAEVQPKSLTLSVKSRKHVFWPRVCSDFLIAKISDNEFCKTHSIPKTRDM